MGEDCQSSIEGNGLIPGKGIVTWCPPKHILPQRNAGGHDLVGVGGGRAKEVCLLFFYIARKAKMATTHKHGGDEFRLIGTDREKEIEKRK